ncbi:GtrA family protein [Escherichia coli]
MLKILMKYSSIGVLNTIIHWAVFALCLYVLSSSQGVANLSGFLVAVTFSFFANAYFTFKKKATGPRYVIFVTFMGFLSFATGALSDAFHFHPIATFLIFSPLSVITGFLFFNFFVFKGNK